MITLTSILILAFIWLLAETDWLRIRLLIGVNATPIVYQYKTWEEILAMLPCKLTKNDPGWLRFPGNMAPLTGWDWLHNTMHIIPEYKIELIGIGYKTTINSNSMPHLRDAFRVNRNPYIKVKI